MVLLHIILLCSIYIPASSIASIAKPNCPTQCGNISIPYPFGIGPGCYVDDWFEVLCLNNNNTTTTTAFLNRTKLEVLQISLQGTLTAKAPITFSNCSNKQEITNQSPNLEGTPFLYSQKNRFTAFSCGALALIKSGSDGSTIGGCMSVCDDGDNIHTTTNVNSCNGMNCCQTTIPSYLKAFNTTFEAIEAERREACKYAFMVDRDWISSSSRNLSSIREMDYVPVVVEWELYYSATELFGKSMETNRTDQPTNDYCDKMNITESGRSEAEICIRNSFCETYNETFSVYNNRSRIQCFCGEGFEGNPYLVEGCQDINECELKPSVCMSNEKCENRPRTYRCYSPNKKSVLKRVYDGIVNFMGLLFLLACPWWIKKAIKKRSKKHLREKFFKRNGGLLLEQQLSSNEANVEKTKLFNSKELEKATNSFSANRVLGQGGQGTVYKGMLADGKIVAVKKSKKVSENKVAEFINEVFILSQINHRNVVRLLGCCLETEVPVLVYEFIPNGTLFDYIHDQKNEDFPLTWETRLRIAAEIAGAFSYLHSSASSPIYHRDIKSTNILLDGKYRAKIADFGTSRSVPIDRTHLTTVVHGTFGYLDPEYFQSSKFTDKSDVYSFGVVMVELLTGQKPISVKSEKEEEEEEEEEEARSLAMYFIECMEENRLFDIVDSGIVDEKGKNDEEIKGVADLAKRCLNLNGRNRPTMKEVAMELESIQKSVEAQQNFEDQVEYITNERSKISWNDVSISIGSSSDMGYTSSIDAIPLLYRTPK